MLRGDDIYNVHADHLGSPRKITDQAGNLVWQWQDKPFGDSPVNQDPDGDGIAFVYNLRFPGQYYDAETGLHYNYFRYYDPRTGRYIQSDPIGLAGGLNTYAYVGGNPVNVVDPKGLRGETLKYYFPTIPFFNVNAFIPGTQEWNLAKSLTQACKNEENEKEITDSAGDNKKRKLVKDQDELLEEANKAAGGSLDDYLEYKPDWWVSPDGKRKIEWNPDGHANTNEGPHVTVRDFNGTRHSVTEKIFIHGQEKYK